MSFLLQASVACSFPELLLPNACTGWECMVHTAIVGSQAKLCMLGCVPSKVAASLVHAIEHGLGEWQLETVYVLEGLGPPHADGSTAPFQGPSFADQVGYQPETQPCLSFACGVMHATE